MLWIDRYAPRTLSDVSAVHPQVAQQLKQLSTNHRYDLPHMILYGPSGAGKTTRALALLHDIFGDGVEKVRRTVVTSEGTASTAQEFRVAESLYHFQVAAADLGTQDRACIQHVIKNLASFQGVGGTFAQTSDENQQPIPKYRVFLVSDAHCLSNGAQAALRRTLEKTVRSARVILICDSLSKLIEPIRSRCLCIRVPGLSDAEISSVLQQVAVKEGFGKKLDECIKTVAKNSEGNLRVALLQLQCASMKKTPTVTNTIQGWKDSLNKVAHEILTADGSPQKLLACREHFYDLMVANVPGQVSLEYLYNALISSGSHDDNTTLEMARAAAHYSLAMERGSKNIYHLEAFAARCMLLVVK